MKNCAQCNNEIKEEVVLPSGRTMYVSVLPYMVGGKEVNLCSSDCVIEYTSSLAFSSARQQVLDSGQSVLQSEGDSIYEVFPDGRKVFVKNIEPPVPVVPGTKIDC